jgi:predicted dehydrogenase
VLQCDKAARTNYAADQGAAAIHPAIRLWIEAIVNNTDPVVLPEQACVVSEILEAIYDSAASGKPVFF